MHHFIVLVLEQVAVPHVAAGISLERHDDARNRLGVDPHRVLPPQFAGVGRRWWYVPTAAEVARRMEPDQLQSSIDALANRAGRLKYSLCGQQKRFSVLVPKRAPS